MKIFSRSLLIVMMAASTLIALAQPAKRAFATQGKGSFECYVQPYYRYRADKKPGRAVILYLNEKKLSGDVSVTVECNSIREQTDFKALKETSAVSVLLPANVGFKGETQARISIKTPEGTYYRSVMVAPIRQWTIYVYPHSHVDIGYTNTQEFVRKLHMRNIDVAIDLAQKTAAYPEGSRFVWNPEATWVTQNYLKEATPEKKQRFINAVRKGWISLDADYGNINTSATTDEELLRLFHTSKEIQNVTGVPVHTMVQMDVAGASWGVTQAAFQNGVHAFLSFPNIGAIRQPWEHRPFYWVSPDGRSKILYFQALPYGYGWEIKGIKQGLFKTQGNDPLLKYMSTADPMVNFINPAILEELSKLESQHSPYDMAVLPWALADNALIDADLPDAVRTWNETYAWPKLIISGSQRIVDDFEKKYSDIIPQIKGDYTEYWTDGLASDAKRISLYRQANENIVQAETLWQMLQPGKPSPRKLIDSAWQDCLLGAEHTWGYQDPKAPLAKQIEATKAGYFENAYKASNDLILQATSTVQAAASNRISVFNTLSWKRSGLITVNKEGSAAGDKVVDSRGRAVASQRLSTGELAFLAEDVPALGSATYRILKGKAAKTKGCTVTGNVLSNGLLTATIDRASGDVVSLADNKTRMEYIDQRSEHHVNGYYYSLSLDTANRIYKPTDVQLTIKEKGPLVVSLVIRSKAEGCNWLEREVKLVKGQRWLELANTLDKISTRTKEDINFSFAFNVPHPTTRIDIPWGVMIPEYDQITGANKNWFTMQRWVDVSNANTGVTWASMEAPLIELGGMTASHQLGGAYGSRNWYKTIGETQPLFSWVINNHWGTNFPLEQGGLLRFKYALMPHGAYDAGQANRFGMEQHRPLIAVAVDKDVNIMAPFRIGNSMIALSNLKESDDGKGLIIRLRSVSDKAEKIGLTWTDGKPRNVYHCLANEQKTGPAAADDTILSYGTITYYVEK